MVMDMQQPPQAAQRAHLVSTPQWIKVDECSIA